MNTNELKEELNFILDDDEELAKSKDLQKEISNKETK